MNGPEHYRAAEELLALITTREGDLVLGDDDAAFTAAAQVHATLALAAATSLPKADARAALHQAWIAVAGDHQ